MITNILTFVLVLGGLIFFHELGHFLIARFFGVGIEKFSIGFGPRIFGCRIGITDYRISAIPLGGYVKMVGDDLDSELNDDMLVFSFSHKHVFKKFLIVLAGPVFNILLAVIVIFIIFYSSGIPRLKPVIGDVLSDTPAMKAGLQSGDIVVSIDQKEINDWGDVAAMIANSHGSVVKVGFIRASIYSTINIEPAIIKVKDIFGQETNKYAIGVISSGDVTYKKLNFLESIIRSFSKTYEIVQLTVLSIIKLVQGILPTKTMGGPIMIADMAGHHFRAGMVDLMFFIALLSVNLAVLNCLPIPVLDGGHLAFFIIEILIGKPIDIKIRELANKAGGLILVLLMVYVFFNDILRLFSK